MSRIAGTTIATVDIGTNKICVLVARVKEDGSFDVVGIGQAQSQGLKKGVVVDVDHAVAAIRCAVKQAEASAGMAIKSVAIGISGSHIHSINSHGVGPVLKKSITHHDITNVLSAAKAIPITEDEQILHVLPQYFIIDGQEVVHNPLNMHGIRLEVEVHIILGRIASVQNLIHCCHRAGLQVYDVVLEQLASAEAVLTEDEQELGVALLDIGGGTSDLAVYKNKGICHTVVIPVAGDHFTNDLAIGLKTSLHEAERIKKEFGVASAEFLHDNSEIEIKLADEQHKKLIGLSEVVHIVEPRARELLALVHEAIMQRQLHGLMTTGLVITGGGALLSGMQQLAESLFMMPVRIGSPLRDYHIPTIINSPVYATGCGLVLQTIKKCMGHSNDYGDLLLTQGIVARMKSWVTNNLL